MEGTVQNVKLDMVGLNWRRRFTDHNAEGEAYYHNHHNSSNNNIQDHCIALHGRIMNS